MERHYYEVNKTFLQALEAEYGLPASVSTRSWETVPTWIDDTHVMIESSKLLDEAIIIAQPLTEEQAYERIISDDYPQPEII